MKAALALPILAVPARAGAVESGEMGFTLLSYKERGLIKVIEPIVWGHAQIDDVWEVRASAAVDVVTGASPELVTNVSGRPVQTVSGASITDHRKTWDAKVTRRVGDMTFSVSQTNSREEDYLSAAYGLEGTLDLDDKTTTLVGGYGFSNDRVRSTDDHTLDAPRYTRQYLLGITQVISPVALVQSTLTWNHGRGDFNDPYKHTLTFYPVGAPAFAFDVRPDHRNSLAWLTRYRQHFTRADGTLQLEYRYYRDDWGIRAHTLEAAWEQRLGERWSLRPALRYYTQSAADFYSPVIPRPQPQVLSSDQRLAAFGGLSPSLRATVGLSRGWSLEGTVGYVYDTGKLHWDGGGSSAYAPLRAVYGIAGVRYAF